MSESANTFPKPPAALLKEKGRLHIRDGVGRRFDWVALSSWKKGEDGVFMIHDIFQLRGLVGNFSEVSLDIVEFSPDHTIFHSPVNRHLESGPISDGIIKFVLLKEKYWNKLLFQLGQQVIFCPGKSKNLDVKSSVEFPLFSKKVKEVFLGENGEVKIIRG